MLRPGHMAVLCAVSLLTLGVVMVNSAGMTMRPGEVVSLETILSSRPAIYMAAAMLTLVIGSLMPVRKLALLGDGGRDVGPGSPGNRITLAGLGLGAAALVGILVLVYLPWIGHEENYSRRWIKPLGPSSAYTIQPSELAKWGLVLLIAWYAARRGKSLGRFSLGLVPALLVVGTVSAVIVVEDLGTGVLIAGACCCVLIAGGAKITHFLAMAPIAIGGIAFAVVTSPYRVKRILTFLDPFADVQGDGYHMIQSMVAVSNGGLAGRGLGHGLQKFGYLPEDTTDFLFAIVCEELGVVGAVVVLTLLGGLVWSLWSVARREKSPVLSLITIGIMATIAMQAVINLLVVTGLGPTKGIALPLLSSGGTGWIVTAFCLGVVVAIDRTQTPIESEHDENAHADTIIEAKPDETSDIEGEEWDEDMASVRFTSRGLILDG